MQLRINLKGTTSSQWTETVLQKFDFFLQDHADCERKASAMALSFVAKYPDRTAIIPELIDTAVEELEHFRDVYQIMQERGVMLNHEIEEDIYVKKLMALCRTGREERFLDRLILASVIECRGAERFRMVYEALEDRTLKDFYHRLWASEAKHGEVFVRLALNYFPEKIIYKRLEELNEYEAAILPQIPFTGRMH